MIFSAKDHTYIKDDKKYTSVSTLIGKYKRPYNGEYWSTYKAYESLLGKDEFKSLRKIGGYKLEDSAFFEYLKPLVDPVKLEKAKLEILKQWDHEKDKSIVKGNNYHSFKEKQSIELGYCTNPYLNKDFKTIESTIVEKKGSNEIRKPIVTNLYDLEDGFHPEAIVWNDDVMVSGQIDKLYIETIKDKRFVDIDDYKGLALGTPIATLNGWKNIEDIKKDDIIFDGNGFPTKVVNVSSIHYNPCYKLTFDTGDVLIADHEHRWVLTERKGTNSYKNKEYTTEQIYCNFSNFTKKKLPRVEIKPIVLPEVNLPIDPYVLGLWLADGNRTCGTITCVNPNIWKEVINRGYTISENHNLNYNKAESRTIYNIRKYLVDLNLLNNKHIPPIYLRSSFNQRLDLLRGLMDGDGHYNKSRKRCVMSTTKEWQCNEVSSLISSLGFKPTIIKAKGKGFGEVFNKYDVCFSPDINPFLVRNQHITFSKSKYSNYRLITKIEPIDTVPTICLAVDSKDKTYLAGINLIKTHNTNKKISKTNFFGKMLFPLDYLDCCNYHHYRLQISTYAWLLEKAGFIPRYIGFTHINTPYRFDYNPKEVELMLTHAGLLETKYDF